MNKILILACAAVLCVATAAVNAEPCSIPEPKCPVPEESDENLVLLPVPTNCKQYVMCNWGVGTIMNCPKNLVFNPELQVCDHKTNVKCIECKEDN